MTYLFLLLGLVVLVVGAELLVRGAVALAELGRISPLVIGLTVVAFGTSAPELAVSSVSSLRGDAEIALGNVVGSNIFNVLFILGISALIVPLSVSSQLVRLDVPLMIVTSLVVWLAAWDGAVDRWEGAAMLVSFAIYTGWLIRTGRQEQPDDAVAAELTDSRPVWQRSLINGILVAVGLGCLVLGAQLLVDAATKIAQQFGVSDMVIGLTIVAAGTSLPELATSIVAAMRGQRDIAVGNVVGSNVFNLLAVLATASVLGSGGVEVSLAAWRFDLVVMLGVALMCWPIFLSHGTISRTEGGVMLVLYVVYTGLLIAEAAHWESIAQWKDRFALGVMPLTVVVFSVLAWRSVRSEATGTKLE